MRRIVVEGDEPRGVVVEVRREPFQYLNGLVTAHRSV